VVTAPWLGDAGSTACLGCVFIRIPSRPSAARCWPPVSWISTTGQYPENFLLDKRDEEDEGDY